MTQAKRYTALFLSLLMLLSCTAALAADAVSPVSVRNEDGTITRNVTVLTLGSVESVIQAPGGAETSVPSSRLIWDRTAPLDKHFAYLYSTTQKSVNLRKTERPKSGILEKAKIGRIVLVAEIGEKYTKIVYGDKEGWVPNKALRYYTPAAEPRYGKISYNGSLTSKSKVNLRQTASKRAKVLTTLAAGTDVVVLGQTDDWYEVDANGWHGWVQPAFLTLGGPVFPAEEEGAAEAASETEAAVPGEETEEAVEETGEEEAGTAEGEEPGDEEEEETSGAVSEYEPLSESLFEPID